MTGDKMILAARQVMDKYRETYELLACAEVVMTRDDDFDIQVHDEAAQLLEIYLRRDIPALAEIMRGLITGDVYRADDGTWKTKGRGPDARDLARLAPKAAKEMEALEAWWSAEKERAD